MAFGLSLIDNIWKVRNYGDLRYRQFFGKVRRFSQTKQEEMQRKKRTGFCTVAKTPCM